jgi:hypothetical protein
VETALYHILQIIVLVSNVSTVDIDLLTNDGYLYKDYVFNGIITLRLSAFFYLNRRHIVDMV